MKRDVISFLRLYLGMLLVVASTAPAFGVIVWPLSQEPMFAAGVGVVGIAGLLLGAFMVTR